jgi:MoaA/NifB/PqqE/SkfB family radical SAM enzyme
MDYDLYCKIIDDLKILVKESGDKPTRLHLYKDGEPLINKRLGEMAYYAKQNQVATSIETTSNGALLTEERAIELIEGCFDVVRISIEHVTAEDYKRITETYSDYEQIKRNVAFLYEESERRSGQLKIYTKILDVELRAEEKEKFLEDFGPISHRVNIDQLMGWSKSSAKDFTLGFSGSTGMNGFTVLRDREVYPEAFSKLAVNFDGQVSVCCVDWSYGAIVGDLRNQSLADVWNGDLLRHFRLLHLRGERKKIEVRADCKYLMGFPEYTILDDKAEKLLKFYS